MGEADALSYLVVGRPLSQAAESEGGELSVAEVDALVVEIEQHVWRRFIRRGHCRQ